LSASKDPPIFNFQVVSFSIFDLYCISKEGYLDVTNVKFH
jgi:hypothetical protein